ncbi:hypothetical protein DTW90_12165 [Neorhizobium sp. P12A]|uniref:hypothetical protein n=1 Tax=Neorhizobium sp. P12A TaxID=2268027 RepID=UPI0011ECD9F3|nr:hypothetical protein [Neorhizobium sp. P12A]KAA0698554.1 hypothetical protein DTW90_12165 [Neorhizobium sp. P12A]
MTMNLKALAVTQERAQRKRELVEQVEDGTLSPGQAQAEADRQNLGRLEMFADKSRFPVAHEPVWSPIMTLAWMFWRDYELVTDFYDPYRKSCQVWRMVPREPNVFGRPPVRPKPDRFLLGSMAPASLSGLKIAADHNNRSGLFNHFPDFAKGSGEFRTALRNGKIDATGIRATNGELERIDSFRWSVLDFIEPGQTLNSSAGPVDIRNFQFVEKHKPGEIYYSDVHLSRLDIEALWPPAPSAEKLLLREASATSNSGVEAPIEIWKRIIDAKQNRPDLRRAGIAELFPNLSTREFDRHWKRATEHDSELGRVGRPKKTSQ